MAITQVSPVQRQPTQRTKKSKTAKGLGSVLGAIGGVAGGIAGVASSGPTTGFTTAAALGTAGAIGGAEAGRSLGGFIGEKIDPSRTITEQHRAAQPLQLSPQGRQFGEALQILNQLPPEIAAPHSRSLTAALMADIAQTNAGRRV